MQPLQSQQHRMPKCNKVSPGPEVCERRTRRQTENGVQQQVLTFVISLHSSYGCPLSNVANEASVNGCTLHVSCGGHAYAFIIFYHCHLLSANTTCLWTTVLVFLNLMLNHLHLQFIRPVLLRHVWVERCLLQMTNYTKACVNSEKPCLMERPAKMQRTETREAFIDGSLDYCF